MKNVLGFVFSLIFVYAAFVCIECFRIKSAPNICKPALVSLSQSSDEEVSYFGYGYKVVYKIERTMKSSDLELVSVKEGSFILFDRFTLWTKKYDNE